MFGLHAEREAMKCKVKTDTLLVARFNTADLKRGEFKPLMAKPCQKCSAACSCVKRVFYTNYQGELEML